MPQLFEWSLCAVVRFTLQYMQRSPMEVSAERRVLNTCSPPCPLVRKISIKIAMKMVEIRPFACAKPHVLKVDEQ
jgi:hypothetical protein